MMTRAILIDPFTETIMDVTMVDTKLQTIKNLIDCEIITVAGIGTSNQYRGIDLILDDEGLLKDKDKVGTINLNNAKLVKENK